MPSVSPRLRPGHVRLEGAELHLLGLVLLEERRRVVPGRLRSGRLRGRSTELGWFSPQAIIFLEGEVGW